MWTLQHPWSHRCIQNKSDWDGTDLSNLSDLSDLSNLSNLSSKEGELDDEKVFELIRGEWVEAKEDEEERLSRV